MDLVSRYLKRVSMDEKLYSVSYGNFRNTGENMQSVFCMCAYVFKPACGCVLLVWMPPEISGM